jgi:hypothetical protein
MCFTDYLNAKQGFLAAFTFSPPQSPNKHPIKISWIFSGNNSFSTLGCILG